MKYYFLSLQTQSFACLNNGHHLGHLYGICMCSLPFSPEERNWARSSSPAVRHVCGPKLALSHHFWLLSMNRLGTGLDSRNQIQVWRARSMGTCLVLAQVWFSTLHMVSHALPGVIPQHKVWSKSWTPPGVALKSSQINNVELGSVSWSKPSGWGCWLLQCLHIYSFHFQLEVTLRHMMILSALF